MPQLHLDEVDADRVPDEVGHLAAGDPRRALDDDARGRRAPRSAAGTRSRSRSPSARTVCAATRSDSASWSP